VPAGGTHRTLGALRMTGQMGVGVSLLRIQEGDVSLFLMDCSKGESECLLHPTWGVRM